MDELDEFIKKIKDKISKQKNANINEASTKEWFIKPFFEHLGWDFANPDEVKPEDDDSTGKRPDYCFCVNGEAKLLVEAKALNNQLKDNKMIAEKVNYCSNKQVPFLIITNGELYKIYYSKLDGGGNDKLLQEFSITDDTIDKEIINKLRKKSFEEDQLLNYAKKIFILSNIKKAIEKIFQEPSNKIIDIINNKLKEILGHKFGNDEIKESLQQFSIQINTDSDESVLYSEDVKLNNEKEDQNKEWTIDDQFKNTQISKNLYQELIKRLNNNIKFEEHPTKFYVSLITNKGSFCQIHGQRKALKIWLNLEKSDLSEQETLKTRDVTGIGHFGMGHIEAIIKNESDFDWIVPLIKKAYNKNIAN